MLDYSIKGIYPLVPLITTTTPDTYYLKGESTTYPTAMLDFDGNERASVHLRDSDLNLLHILLQQMQRRDLSEATRKAATEAFFATIDRRRVQSLGGLFHVLGEQEKQIRTNPTARTFRGTLRRILEITHPRCEDPTCFVPAKDCQGDHIEPWAHGGPTVMANGRMACGHHNRDRNQRPPPDP